MTSVAVAPSATDRVGVEPSERWLDYTLPIPSAS